MFHIYNTLWYHQTWLENPLAMEVFNKKITDFYPLSIAMFDYHAEGTQQLFLLTSSGNDATLYTPVIACGHETGTQKE